MAAVIEGSGAEPSSAGGVVRITAEDLGIQQGDAEYETQLEFDLGNMMASDPSPLDLEALAHDPSGHCLEVATRMTQALVGRLFLLPSRSAPEGRIAQLPPPTTALPRAKPLPKPREPTRWEKFATRKGIVKKKRPKLVFDEQEQEWRRRYGYKRANDVKDIPIVEAGANDEVGDDPFSQMAREKNERVKTNAKRQLANMKANAKAGDGQVQLPPTLKLAASLPEHGKGRPIKRKDMHNEIKAASKLSGVSTASMGKFDERLPGEKPGERQLAGKRRKFAPLVNPTELPAMTSMVDRLIRERADDIIDVDRAIGKVEAERREDRRKEKLEASAEGGDGAKGKGGKGKKPMGRKRGPHRAAGQEHDKKGKKGVKAKGGGAKGGRDRPRVGKGKGASKVGGKSPGKGKGRR